MIAINELRIGNLFYNRRFLGGPDLFVDTVKILVHKDAFPIDEFTTRIYDKVNDNLPENIEPIPLNDELLNKLGFIQNGSSFEFDMPGMHLLS